MSSEERQARSLALEKAYVHDVYDQIAPHFTDTRYRAWPRVKQFLLDLEPASLVADVGCGNGKYLDVNRDVMKIGSDRCAALTAAARAKNHEVVTCDNLQLPFRDETFDAALSIAVIHHFATTDRRVTALKELARVLRIGGKVLITVWAMEQRHRKFDSQDVLVPWHEPVKSSSEDRASSVEREMTSTTTSDDDVLVYHAYSHISDSEAATAGHRPQASGSGSNVNRRRQKFRNGRGRYRSAGSFDNCNAGGNSRSSSELSSPNETCYSFVKRALQKLSSSTSSNAPYHSNKSNARPYFYRSCRKPWVSTSMEFGPNLDVQDPDSSRNELYHQSSIESECPDQPNEDDIPIELRHLEGYEPCTNCGSPVRETDRLNRCETHVCASCLPIDPDSSGKKSRSLGDFFNMIPKLLRVKKCEKEPLSDLHKRISTASDPREYVVKSRGSNINGIVRSKSTVSFMSRLEEIMSFSVSSEKNELEAANSDEVSRSKDKPSRLPSLTASSLVDGDCPIILPEADRSTNPRRYNSPADALRKLRQDVSLDEPELPTCEKLNNLQQIDERNLAQDNVSSNSETPSQEALTGRESNKKDVTRNDAPPPLTGEEQKSREQEQENSQESHLSSYYSMPELYKLAEEQVPCNPIYPAQRQRHISFYEQAQTIMRDTESTDKSSEINTASRRANDCAVREGSCISVTPQRVLVKRSLSVDTGDNSSSSHQCPRRFSASAAQGVLASALRSYSLPRSSSRGSSVKSDTSIDSEESIVSVIPRKGNSITSDTSVDSEESVISVIQRSTSEIETLVRESGLRNNISRLGSRSARASPVTVLSSQTSSAESSPPQSGKNDGKFPGSGAVIDQLMQQQQMSLYSLEGVHLRQDSTDYVQRTRRSLLRPISDPRIEERFSSNSFDETNSAYRSSSRQASGSNRSSLESDDQVIKEEDEKCCDAVGSLSDLTSSQLSDEQTKSDSQTAELSRTPSPIGPFKYIFDTLLDDVSPSIDTKNCQSSKNSSTVQNSSNHDGLQDEKDEETSVSIRTEVLKQKNISEDIQTEGSAPDNEFESSENLECTPDDSNSSSSSKSAVVENKESTFAQVEITKTSTEAERHEKLRKLSQRLENLGLSSELLKSFYMSSEDNEDDVVDNSQNECGSSSSQTAEHEVEETPQEVPCSEEAEEIHSDSVCTESVQEKSDEDSAIDESLKTVIHDIKNVNMEFAGGNIPNCEDIDTECTNRPQSVTSLNIDKEQVPNAATSSSSKANSPNSTTDQSGEQKVVVRHSFRKRLKRSCVTIDEVECREVISSEDTSPSSSASLEWNDFDKVESSEVDCQGVASTSGAPGRNANLSNVRPREEDTITSPEDVNVAETEHKFNVFLDKEICVFFETPSSSSIGKSASSSSNATDFSTTSDRIRGVMQREKSDDRSSKESDSDNLSKLSDVEPKSDSAFSEDFARRADLDCSCTELAESHRSKMDSPQSWSEYDGGGPSTSKAWVLDNIDEISDDDKQCNSDHRMNPKLRRDWSEEDKSMDFVQKRENFFNCAGDCRDMYRMRSGDTLANRREEAPEVNCVREESGASGAVAENHLVVHESTNKDSDDSEVPTDILAAFVETISDLTSVFGELYPRHEGKFEDVSSDESLEISSFERILTSQDPQPVPDQQEEKSEEKAEETDRWFNKKEAVPAADGASVSFESTSLRNADYGKKVNNSDKLPKHTLANGSVDHPKMSDHHSKLTRHQRASQDTKSNIQDQCVDSSSVTDDSKPKTDDRGKQEKPSKKTVENLDLTRKATAKPKLLNRSSQSVCQDKFRHDSLEDEFSTSKTQSAPCSPRLKPRQRSVEEVLSTSKAELSRNSSLSQSTSQESLPGNESGGLMAYHRYYHVFRQGELDNLIENYVENLHIIASYYDHANWCVVAEKVQVWTI